MNNLLAKLSPRVRAALSAVAAGLLFLAIWALLDTFFNLRYPGREKEPPYWYLLPSIDVCLLFALFGVLGILKVRVPIWISALLALVIIFIRLFRVADGLVQQNYFRNVNLFLDMPMLPELARLMRSTVPMPKLIIGAFLIACAFGLMALILSLALLFTQRYLASGWTARGLFGAVVLAAYVMSSQWDAEDSPKLHKGLFGTSVGPVAMEQMRFIASAKALREAKARQIQAVQDRLAHTPSDLAGLKRADFLFVLVESYGSSVFRNAYLNSGVGPMLEKFGAAMEEAGYSVASNFYTSSTYGGGSWMAHATLNSGVRVGDGLEYAVMLQTDPPPRTMPQVFRQAGYRTVLVQPGTTRPFPEGLTFGFDKKYYSWNFDYLGPPFGWATVPDEYVVDFIQRQELDRTGRGPEFVQYALVSSHAPWAVVPLAVNDWSKIGRGQIFKDYQAKFPISWGNLKDGAPAYCYSLYYDFDVLRRYILERLKRDTFVVIMGDHQPAAVITNNDPSWAVPLHVLSKNRKLIERFNEAGYAPGMTPPLTGGSVAGLETLLPELMELLSTPAAH
jgi:hypothetical protein